MKVIILAGGSGTRLWPVSRKNYPKQFMKVNGKRSLLQNTIERLLPVVNPDDIIILTNKEYKFYVESELNSLLSDDQPSVFPHIILEPACRNTAPAIALGIKYCMEKLECPKEEVLFISPCDHIIKPVDKFCEYVRRSEDIAKDGYIVTFGIKPISPETGYGYIKAKNKGKGEDGRNYLIVERFTEKPDAESARNYFRDGNYYWNSGIFVFKIGRIEEEFMRYVPEIGKTLELSLNDMMKGFAKMPSISFDYAVMERSERIVTIPAEIYWSDIGSWDSLFEILDKDENGNVKIGDVITMDSKETMIIGDKRLIATIGLKDCLVIETDDAILIAQKGETQKVKNLVDKLILDGRKEVLEHVTTYRPWGSYTILEEGQRYKIKRVVVNPGERLSLQKHFHRSEHWVVIKGTAKVTIGNKETYIHENESAYVPKSTPHRLENPGKVQLEIIEVQNGEYVEEDDIVRMEDVYGRMEE
ncbi:MAG: mannose-1-phosphate guanylyltransferase/mannose-6-phosphate isomerase [Nitrospirae bacterium]|nr:mannose-1-phosphate guanylyltransferase/mannose-6-phosphate isomerase [Nitrospirota bacterium]